MLFRSVSTACIDCVVGKVQPLTGTTGCVDCAVGTFQPSTGATACHICATGTIAATTGLTACTDCATGTMQGDAGESACEDCIAGTFVGVVGANECQVCAVGKIATAAGRSVCTACAAGRWKARGFADVTTTVHGYKKSSATGTCDLSLSVTCPNGHQPTMASFPQTRANALMAPNTQTSALQESPKYCTACAAGFYNNAADGSACIACTAGQYQDTTGQTACKAHSDLCVVEGKKTKSAADINKLSTTAKESTCTACAAGKYNAFYHNTACDKAVKCSAGEGAGAWDATAHTWTCTQCVAGMYASAADHTAAIDFAEGLVEADGTTAKAATVSGGAACKACASGTVQLTAGATASTDCAANSCKAGHYLKSSTTTKCQDRKSVV